MKKPLLLVSLAASALLFTGCKPDGAKINTVLDAVLPPEFVGNADFGHKNVYFDFDIRATGLRRTANGWTWTSLSYKRNGRFSTGWINLSPSASSPAP